MHPHSFSPHFTLDACVLAAIVRDHGDVDDHAVVARPRVRDSSWATSASGNPNRLSSCTSRIGGAHVGDDRDAALGAGWKDSPHAIDEQRVETRLWIRRFRELRERNRALGQALEDEIEFPS